MSCRICSQQLPGGGAGEVVICPTCGAVGDVGSEVAAYAVAVAAGRSDATPPAPLSRHRLTVRLEQPMAAGYRHAGMVAEARGRLTIRVPYFGLRSVMGLLLALGAVAGLVYVGRLSIWASNYVLLVVAAVPVVAFVWLRVAALVDGLLIRVADGVLRIRTSRFWPKREVVLPVGRVQQLFVVRRGLTYTLFANTGEAEAKPLIEGMADPALAGYFERQLEAALGLGTGPVLATVPMAPGRPFDLRRIATVLGSVWLQLGVVVLVLVSVVALLRIFGAELAEATVIEQPRELAVDVPAAGRVFFTAEVDLVDDVYNSHGDLPHSAVIRIEITRDGAPVADLTCDPVVTTAWVTRGQTHEVGSYWGPMDDCAVELDEPGELDLVVWRAWKPGVPRLRLESTVLGVRQR